MHFIQTTVATITTIINISIMVGVIMGLIP